MLYNLESTCHEILCSRETNFDVWEIQVFTDSEDGDIQKTKGGELESIGVTQMTKYMCHSFSFGSDARTGLSFERRRTRNRV